MTLREWGVREGYLLPNQLYGRCPMHPDYSPSACWNPNGIWCFTESRHFPLREIGQKHNVYFEYDESESYDMSKETQFYQRYGFEKNQTLFIYPWEEKDETKK